MQIRCGSCHGAVWVEMTSGQASVKCPTCGKDYVLQGGAPSRELWEQLAGDARQLARETQVDLPSCYSVLLGVMSLEEALELGDLSSPACRTAPEGPPTGQSKSLVYDPAFQPAVEEGLLTPLQAMQRGKRHGYALLATKRHRLPENLALDVADNRISLLEALRRRGPDPGPHPMQLRENQGKRRPRVLLWVAGLVAVVAFVVVAQVSKSPDPMPTLGPPRTVPGAEVRTDEWGRVLEVSALDPKTVLAGFCAAGREKAFEPIDVVPSAAHGTGVRLGLVRRTGRSGELLAIEVREDRVGNRWVAGDGKRPIVPRTAPAAAQRGI